MSEPISAVDQWLDTLPPIPRDPGEDDVDPADDAPERLRTCGLLGSEFLSLEFPPVVWLVDGILEAQSTTCIYGPPNCGKTFLLLECVVRALACDKRVLLYEEEGSAAGLQQRLLRAASAHALTTEQADRLRVVHNAGIDLGAGEIADQLIRQAIEHRADLVALDSLSAMAGGRNENDSDIQGQLANTIHRIKAETGAAVTVLHHMTKDGWAPSEKPSLRTMRGHGALPGRLDAAIAVVQCEEETSETKLVFDIHETKRREGARAVVRRCEIDMPAAGLKAHCQIYELDHEAKRADAAKARLDEMCERMVAAVAAAMPHGLTTGELRETVTGKTAIQSAALAELLRPRGRLTRDHTTRRVVLAVGTTSGGSDEP